MNTLLDGLLVTLAGLMLLTYVAQPTPARRHNWEPTEVILPYAYPVAGYEGGYIEIGRDAIKWVHC